jgi:hypothetical protein
MFERTRDAKEKRSDDSSTDQSKKEFTARSGTEEAAIFPGGREYDFFLWWIRKSRRTAGWDPWKTY